MSGRPTHQRAPSDLPPSKNDEIKPVAEPLTLGAWMVLVFPIGFVYAIVPLFCAISLQHVLRFHRLSRLPEQHWTYSFLLWTAHAEVAFTLYYQYCVWRAQARKSYPKRSKEFLHNLLLQCLSVGVPVEYEGQRRPKQIEEPDWDLAPLNEITILRTKLRAWFYYAPMSSIKADNVRDWLAWALTGGQYLEEARQDPDAVELVEEGLRMTQRRLRWTFPEGRNPDLTPMRLTLDPVQALSRPLGYYVVCCSFGLVTYAWLMFKHGFRMESRHGLQLLVKPPTEGKSQFTKPVVFLHGLGVGLAQNVAFLKKIARSTEGVVLLLQPGISTHIWHPRFFNPPPKEAYVAAVKEACESIGVKQAAILSQSNGTMVHGWLLRGCPELCQWNVLVDCVSFKLWEADVCWAFLHKPRTTALQCLLSYFVLTEVGIAHSISRDFQWTDMLLFEHELPSVSPDRCRIILGEKDPLVDSPSIIEYLRECGMPEESMKLLKGGYHGTSLVRNGEGMEEVMKML